MKSIKNTKRILFVEPSGSSANIFTFAMKLPLFGPIGLATRLHNAGYNVFVIKENLLDRDDNINNYLEKADILILTLLTITANHGYEISQLYKKIRPDGKVIIGGMHASLMPEEVSHYADQVAVGEGDNIIIDLIEGTLKDKIIYGTPLENFDDRPIPDFSLLKNSEKLRIIPIMTSIGCPFNCTFCCVSLVYGRKYRIQSPERTINEIKQQMSFFKKKKKIYFYDDNFCANKKLSLQLFDKIEEEGLKFKWLASVRADIAEDEQFVKRMADVGCRLVFIGFESINEETLRGLNKRETFEQIKGAIKIFHKYGISIHGMFIYGSDEDDYSIFNRTIKFCRKNMIEFGQFTALTAFPGTDLSKQVKSQILNNNWDYYDGLHVTFKPKKISEWDVMNGILKSYKKVFSWWKILKQMNRDFFYLFKIRSRTFKYRIYRMFNDFGRNIGMKISMKRWTKINENYLMEIQQKYKNISVLINK